MGTSRVLSLALCWLLFFPGLLPARNFEISESELASIESNLSEQRRELAALRQSLLRQTEISESLLARLTAVELSLSDSQRRIAQLSNSLQQAETISATLEVRLRTAQSESSEQQRTIAQLKTSFDEYERQARRQIRNAWLRGLLTGGVGGLLLGAVLGISVGG